MGNCGSSIDCGQCYGEEGCLTEIEVDADIAGIGVLVAFFLASAVTCASIFYGYLTDSLPDSLLSDTDFAAIRRFQNSFINRRILHWLSRGWYILKKLCYRCVGRNLPEPRPPIPKGQRVEAVTRFILGFSDQQLVTGLAIMISALANRCHITLYELQIVFCLAWFSATTHLATLKVLHEYFYENKVVRNWRVIGILTFLVLLAFFQGVLIVAGDGQDPTEIVNHATPMQCIIDGRTQKRELGGLEILTGIYLLNFLLYIYLKHTGDLFRNPHRINCLTEELSQSPLVAGSQITEGRRPTAHDRRYASENVAIQHEVLMRNNILPGIKLGVGSVRKYRYSFLSYLPTILFSLTYGISQTVVVTWVNSPKTTGDVRRMGFGQVVSLALLAIPALTASEIYNEARSSPVNNSEDVLDTQDNPRQSPSDLSSASNHPTRPATQPEHIKHADRDPTKSSWHSCNPENSENTPKSSIAPDIRSEETRSSRIDTAQQVTENPIYRETCRIHSDPSKASHPPPALSTSATYPSPRRKRPKHTRLLNNFPASLTPEIRRLFDIIYLSVEQDQSRIGSPSAKASPNPPAKSSKDHAQCKLANSTITTLKNREPNQERVFFISLSLLIYLDQKGALDYTRPDNCIRQSLTTLRQKSGLITTLLFSLNTFIRVFGSISFNLSSSIWIWAAGYSFLAISFCLVCLDFVRERFLRWELNKNLSTIHEELSPEEFRSMYLDYISGLGSGTFDADAEDAARAVVHRDEEMELGQGSAVPLRLTQTI
ncbi:hypothetical protein DM02DRAFT_662651 [Periconia macrospinosa]|uniref:Uncharacterized protein n=1 Tax=Periconia macrospinosa TaxID=97972 RepID=A0A2V1D681_9PLEO|nr:hypothetical protein DM02DRAFT_662651 [Periconia macrospinosa]